MLRTGFAVMFALVFCPSSVAAEKASYNGSASQLAEMAATYERARVGKVATPADLEAIGYFKGFVEGVFVSGVPWCTRDDAPIPMGVVHAVVAKYLRENPERWGMQA